GAERERDGEAQLAGPAALTAVAPDEAAVLVVAQDPLALAVQHEQVSLRIAGEPRVLELVVLVLDYRTTDHGERVEAPRERRRGVGGIAQAFHAVHRVDRGDERVARGHVGAARGGCACEQEQERSAHGRFRVAGDWGYGRGSVTPRARRTVARRGRPARYSTTLITTT